MTIPGAIKEHSAALQIGTHTFPNSSELRGCEIDSPSRHWLQSQLIVSQIHTDYEYAFILSHEFVTKLCQQRCNNTEAQRS